MISLSGRRFGIVTATFVDKLKFVGLCDSVRTDRDIHFQDRQSASQII